MSLISFLDPYGETLLTDGEEPSVWAPKLKRHRSVRQEEKQIHRGAGSGQSTPSCN